MKNIPYSHQSIYRDDIEEVVKILKSDWITQGPKIAEFERALCDYTGAKYAVAVSSGTAALHIACLAAGLKYGDEVITSPITFVASANCALYCGAKAVFADVDPATANIDPVEIAKKISKRTKIIIPVHFAGNPCDIDEIKNIAKKNGLMIIEDACHALGAEYKGKKIGVLSDMTVFSFHPVKSIATGEGGAILTDDKKLYDKLSSLRTHGITKDPSALSQNDGPWYYEMQSLGYNYRMTDMQCALGISQLRKLDIFLRRRREIADIYDNRLAKLDEISLPIESPSSRSSWHLYCIRIKNNSKRKTVFEKLRKARIGVQVHYIPVYHHPFYQKLGYKKSLCKNAEEFYRQEISIPIYPSIQNREIEFVAEKIERALL